MNPIDQRPARVCWAVLLVSILLTALTLAPGGFLAADGPDAKADVQKVLESQAAAWNKNDLSGFMAGYWNSPELTFYSGNTKTKGWQATLERYQKRYQTDKKSMGKLTFSELQVEPLGVDSAWVGGRWNLELPDETLKGLFTLIFKKTPQGWKIIHDHTSAG
jgi:beta-aspartyl-peptidase (threonine type)